MGALEDRFWAKVHKGAGDNACWLWQAAMVPEGYGSFGYQGRQHGAHRMAWLLTYGALPEGLFVCHNCPGGDNPRCVNPAHLFLGTPADNNTDRHAKGRTVNGGGAQKGEQHHFHRNPELLMRLSRGDSHYTRAHPERRTYGERHGNAKLTTSQVLEIRARYAVGGVTYHELAREYDVDKTCIGLIVRHVTRKAA